MQLVAEGGLRLWEGSPGNNSNNDNNNNNNNTNRPEESQLREPGGVVVDGVESRLGTNVVNSNSKDIHLRRIRSGRCGKVQCGECPGRKEVAEAKPE
mmetsp:Transcript_38471/g.81587  ORF Transcript_38471/g.81587 Transcript_38471/m.81587 type:complete len:97 (-) Transcript_38471:306-596(-)